MLSVNYTECHKQAHCAECYYDECRYAECRYDECRGASQWQSSHLQICSISTFLYGEICVAEVWQIYDNKFRFDYRILLLRHILYLLSFNQSACASL
jgi:hypothetical protein